MTKDLGNLDQCKRALEDTNEELRKYDNILKHLYPESDLENNSHKVILTKRNHLAIVKIMLERQLNKYKVSKNVESFSSKKEHNSL